MLYMLLAQEGQNLPLMAIERVVFGFNGDKEAAKNFVREQQLNTRGVKYRIVPLGDMPSQQPIVLAIQHFLGNGANLSAADVQAAQSGPHGQAGQNRQAEEPDGLGFQKLNDDGLALVGDEAIFGRDSDGTYSDIILEGGGAREVPRQC